VQKGDFNTASEYFKKILSLKPDNPEAHYNIGIIFFQANQTEKVIEELKIALKLREDFALAHKSLAFALLQMNQIAEAILHFEKYVEITLVQNRFWKSSDQGTIKLSLNFTQEVGA